MEVVEGAVPSVDVKSICGQNEGINEIVNFIMYKSTQRNICMLSLTPKDLNEKTPILFK
jgi:hypothetical protein